MVVVENGSNNESATAIAEASARYANVELVRSPVNLGYFAGAKLGLAHHVFRAGLPDWTIICNNDVSFPDRQFFAKLLERDGKRAAVIAPAIVAKLTNLDSNPYLRERPSPLRLLRYRVLLSSYYLSCAWQALVPFARILKHKCAARWQAQAKDKPHPIYAPHGAFIIFTRRFFESGGYVDDGFFLYAEEFSVAEICRHLRLPIVHDPDLSISHDGHQTTGRMLTRAIFHHQRNGFRYAMHLLRAGPPERLTHEPPQDRVSAGSSLADVSIIVVNYNTIGLLRDCLSSVMASEARICETIVVDNASTDGSAEMVEREFPAIRLLRNEQNLGFAKANNQGIKVARGRYMLLLNSDTIVRPGAIATMAAFLEANTVAGATACRLLNADGTIQPSVGNRLGATFLLFRLLGIARLISGEKVRRRLSRISWVLGRTIRAYLVPYAAECSPIEIESVSAACLMIRKDAIDDIGLLDERFFMYLEDIDYCLRLHRGGWKLYYLPAGEVVHLGGGSSAGRMRNYNVQSYRALFLYYRKHFPYATLIAARLMVATATGVLWLWNWVGSKLSGNTTYQRDERDLRRIIRACFEPTLRA